MLPPGQLRTVLPTLPRIPLRGPWYRAVNHDYVAGPPPGATPGSPPQPLWSGGAARQGARFTPRATSGGLAPPIDCLYLAEDELTPLLEVTSVLRPAGGTIGLVFEPQVMMTVDGVLTDVLDLTDTAIQAALAITHQTLTGHWVLQQAAALAGQGSLPPTQLLGREAFRARTITGLRYPSSKNPAGVGVVIFTARLLAGRHALRVVNRPGGALQGRLP